MIGSASRYRDAIAAVRPDLADLPMVIHSRGWDSDAAEVAGWIFKFPKRPEAIERLRLEARILAIVRPRVPLTVPDLRLYETPTLFSEHRMIPGTIIETREYDALSEMQKQAMAARLAAFYTALHAIPVGDAIGIGVGPKPGWPPADTVFPVLAERLPANLFDHARRAFAAYAALPAEDEVLGYFDGHGWNMAFDHERGVLNGVYDFADAGIGPRSRDFTYSNLTSGDLTLRIVAAYNRATSHTVDPRTVAIRTAVQTLAELAEAESEVGALLGGAMRWHDFMQSHAETRI